MMRPDLRIAIAYGSERAKTLAATVAAKLNEYAEMGYPVKIGFVNEERDKYVEKIRRAQRDENGKPILVADAGDAKKFVAEAMESVFMDFDCAIFLFDHRKLSAYRGNEKLEADLTFKDEEDPEDSRPFHLVSGNLLFEYGMATSIYKHRGVGSSKGSPIVSYELSKLDEKLYAFRLDPFDLTRDTDEQRLSIIIEDIHKFFVEPNFYGIKQLPCNI